MAQVLVHYDSGQNVIDAATQYLDKLIEALPGYGNETKLFQNWIINGNDSQQGSMVATKVQGSKFPPFPIGVKYNEREPGRVTVTSNVLTEDQIRETLNI